MDTPRRRLMSTSDVVPPVPSGTAGAGSTVNSTSVTNTTGSGSAAAGNVTGAAAGLGGPPAGGGPTPIVNQTLSYLLSAQPALEKSKTGRVVLLWGGALGFGPKA